MVMRLPLEDLWRGRASLRCFTASPRTLWCSESLQRASLWHSSILPPPPPPGRTSLWSRCLLLEDHCRRRTSLWFSLFGGPFCGVNSPRRTSLRFFSPPPPLEDLSMVLVPPTGELYGFLPSPWRTSVRSASPRRTSLCFPSLLLEVLSMVTSRGEGEEVTSRGRSRHLEDH